MQTTWYDSDIAAKYFCHSTSRRMKRGFGALCDCHAMYQLYAQNYCVQLDSAEDPMAECCQKCPPWCELVGRRSLPHVRLERLEKLVGGARVMHATLYGGDIDTEHLAGRISRRMDTGITVLGGACSAGLAEVRQPHERNNGTQKGSAGDTTVDYHVDRTPWRRSVSKANLRDMRLERLDQVFTP
mmetsp:Transcript_2414/g.5727  ORF Transcript_2414/g.5727 Transcript_2414/m.5727 type:complete len:185 (+) Transcript_2414:532-1086(+)